MARRVLAITLVGTSLLVAACGSDDDSSRTGAGTTDGSASQSPGTADDAAGNRQGGSGGNGSSSPNNGGDRPAGRRASPGKGSRGREGSRGTDERQPGFSSPGLTPGPPGVSPDAADDAPPLARSDAAAHRLAKEICSNVTLEGIALNLRINLAKRDPEFVARAFSRRYPRDHRDAAYRGCLEGFRNPVERP